MHFLPLLFAVSAVASPNPFLAKRVSGTSTVTLSNNTGTPGHLASGFIYGIPGKIFLFTLHRLNILTCDGQYCIFLSLFIFK
jgi:hypothetical protein